nr:TetR/AcrR family transcriptional regulator [Motilibacter deserti]
MEPEERRERIVEAASAAFTTAPYREVGLAGIALAASASEALVYRYFTGKAELYAEVVRRAVDRFVQRQDDALAQLAPGAPVRDRIRAATLVHLDTVAAHPAGWGAPLLGSAEEPAQVAQVRTAARADQVERLRALLKAREGRRREFALWGFFGFLDTACLRWVDTGCPEQERWPLVEAALGALEGGLGDWDA